MIQRRQLALADGQDNLGRITVFRDKANIAYACAFGAFFRRVENPSDQDVPGL